MCVIVSHLRPFKSSYYHLLIFFLQFSTSGNFPYHKSCYKENYHPKCDVCKHFVSILPEPRYHSYHMHFFLHELLFIFIYELNFTLLHKCWSTWEQTYSADLCTTCHLISFRMCYSLSVGVVFLVICIFWQIPTNPAGLIEYRAHPFWIQKYCPSHEHDNTPRCCSCERMEVGCCLSSQRKNLTFFLWPKVNITMLV